MCLIGFNKFSFQHSPNSLGSLKLQGLRKTEKGKKEVPIPDGLHTLVKG